MSGNTTKLNDDVIMEMAENVRNGIALRIASDAAGIGYENHKQYMRRGYELHIKEPKSIYVRYYKEIKSAQRDAVRECIKQIQIIGRETKQWTAFAWILERMYSQTYGKDNEDITQMAADIEELKAIIMEETGRSSPPKEETKE